METVSVLYVDDEPDLLEIAQLFLEKSGEFGVTTSTSAQESLESPQIASYDVIVSDYQMPHMDGIAFLKAVREQCGDIPFILFTGRGREEVVIEALNEGADFYLQKGGDVKPQFAELIHKIRQVVRRRHAEKSVSESEDKFRSLVENALDAILILDFHGEILFANNAVMKLAEVSDSSGFLGRNIMDFITPESREDVIKDFIRVSQGHDSLYTHYQAISANGKKITIECIGKLVTYEGRPADLLSIRDITDRKRAEKALWQSEEKYRRILENMQDAYIRTDEKGVISMVNPSAVRMFGYNSAEEIIGIPASSLYLRSGDREELLRIMRDTGGITDFSGDTVRKDGTCFRVSLNVQFIRDEKGSVLGTEGIVRDITERKSMEHVIQETNRKLNFLNSITRHDIVNQLVLIQGFIRLAAMKESDPVISEILSKINAGSDMIHRQIGFMKTYQELGVHTPVWFRLSEIVGKTGREEIVFSGTCKDIEIFSDPMFEKVFFNLFENAMQYGERVTEIIVRCEQVPDGIVIIVEDNGVGISQGEKEKIFDKGFGKNTGFGLFLAKEILSITGITIQECGIPGKGAKFEIAVPKGRFRSAL